MTELNKNADKLESTDGRFDTFEKYIFKISERDRLLSWEKGAQIINIGGKLQDTASARNDVLVSKGTYLAVDAAKIKLDYKEA
ncbi:hypothetical protein FLAG1_06189 [Fusarium langsethiae]|uniref:Uncharacterized protein n=1 Tax=Fusarium langsethiae TaxID=179993 RepID=A0A0N0DEE1_FUSLA|nr:hypothetical protein FLAG1_06189 [Fusarium langsethiae]